MKIVLDTNVLVSGLINPHHAPGRIIDQLRNRTLQLTVDDRILAEYYSVLMGTRLRKWVDEDDARNLLAFLFFDSERIVASIHVHELPDPGDVPFLEVSMTANVPLVTGNLKHFPAKLRRGHVVLTPVEFLRTL